MSPLSGTEALLPGVRASLQAVRRTEGSSRAPAAAPEPVQTEPRSTARLSTSGLSILSSQATIMRAEMLLQIASTAASSPALRQIAAAAYQMEIDARREIAQARVEGMNAGRQWFA